MFWAAAIGALVIFLAAIVGAIAAYQVNSAIPKRAAEIAERLDAQLMQQPVSAWPVRLLMKHDWKPEKTIDTLTVYVHHPETDAVGIQPTGIQIRRGEQTLAWAEAVPFGERYVWPYAQVSDHLEDGQNAIPIVQVVAGTGIADFIRQTGAFPVEVIGVGLESSDGGDPKDTYRELSDDRGMNLAEAVNRSITVMAPGKELRFRTVGLGRALTRAAKNSDPERRQRSALIIVVARMSQDTINLPDTPQLTALLMDVDLKVVDLTDYEYSAVAARRLSVPIVFDGSGGQPWTPPKIPIAEALAARVK